MAIYMDITVLIFGLALLTNAILPIPQAMKIWRGKTSRGVSLITFIGFWLTQLAIVMYGFIEQNYWLIVGYLLSMVISSVVIFLIICFRKKENGYIKGEKITLEDVIKQLPGHLYWKNKQGQFLGCNTQQWKDVGFRSLEENIGKTDYDFFPKEQADNLTYIDNQVIKTGKLHIAEEKSNLSDGTAALYLSYKAPLKNKKGEIIGCAGVSLDITKARRVEIERLELLENIIALMPGHVYWIDRDGIYQGCNDEQARSAGLKNRKEIVGKRNKDLPWHYNTGVITETIDKINQDVMENAKAMVTEEPAVSLENGKQITVLSSKVPIKNKFGQVTGLVGISVDITDKKEAEALRAKQALIDVAAQVSHDIRSPLAALNTVLRNLPTIPEDQRVLIRNAVTRINDIANNLLVEYRGEIANSKTSEKTELLSSLLDTLLSEKKAQISNRRVELNLEIEPDAFALFTSVDSTHFKRVISNLLNNAIEAIEGTGKVTARLEQKAGSARIRLTDTGKGMPPAVLDKIKRGGTTHGKTSGTGIGISSAINFIEHCGGHFDMTSTEGQGTTVTIDLPTGMTPTWFQETLAFTPGSTVVILDDDESIHAIWTSRCQTFRNDITLTHIHHSTTFRQYCATADLSHSFFLMDYELLGSDETGLDLIEALNLSDRAILVTSRYEETSVQERVKKLGVKIIPKNFSPYIPISLTQQQQLTEEQLADDQPALVFIDDDKTLTRAWEQAAEFADLSIKTFNRTADFRKVLLTLPKTTPIYIDSNLCEPISGEVFAKELYEQGRTELYLASGHPRGHFGDLPWIKDFVGKEPPF